jgi:hypothetical protein
MNPVASKNKAGASTERPESEETGLPGFRTWAKVYWLVAGVFVVVVFLLAALSRMFS